MGKTRLTTPSLTISTDTRSAALGRVYLYILEQVRKRKAAVKEVVQKQDQPEDEHHPPGQKDKPN